MELMKKILICVMALFTGQINAQLNYNWHNISSSQNNSTGAIEASNSIALDPATNTTYVVGTFSGTLTLPGLTALTSMGSTDIYVAEFNSSGVCTQRIRLGTTNGDIGLSIAYGLVGTNRYVFVSGVEEGHGVLYRLDAGNLGGTNIRRVLDEDQDTGHPQYGNYMGATENAYSIPRTIAFYGNQLIVCGSYYNITSFPSTSGFVRLTSSGIITQTGYNYLDAFASRFNTNLQCLAAIRPTQSGADNEVVAIACRNQKIYMTGYFKKDNAGEGNYNMPLRFASAATATTASGTRDIFVVSANIPTSVPSSLNYNNDMMRGGSNFTEGFGVNSIYECGHGITANATGIFLTGYVNPGATFGTTTLSSGGAFIARINYNGSIINNTAPAWAYVGNTCPGNFSGLSVGRAIASDANHIYVVGEANSSAQLVGLTGAFCVGSPTESPGFIAKYNNNGDLLLMERIDNDGSVSLASGTMTPLAIVVNSCYLAFTGYSNDDDYNTGLVGNLTGVSGTYSRRFITAATNSIATDPLAASITGNNSFCYGSPVSFTGSASAGTAYNSYWEIVESNSSGTPVAGGYSYNTWTGAAPGVFTFPANIACGKYYKVTLTLTNGCGSATTTKVIFINCLPNINLGNDVSICSESCITLSVANPESGVTYTWTPGNLTGTSVNVCPTSTTNYTVTGTFGSTGCSASDQVVVNVLNMLPDFNVTPNLNAGSTYYTVFAQPVVTNVSGIPGFSFGWWVEEVTGPASSNPSVVPNTLIPNSNCWWGSLSTNFNGYNGTNTMPNGCNGGNPGQFTEGHYYRITRGVWSDQCPWRQYSVIVFMEHVPITNSVYFVVEENVWAPDFSNNFLSSTTETAPVNIHVYPNPSSGLFTIEISNQQAATIEILDLTGKTIITKNIGEISGTFNMDLSGYAKGMYFVKIVSGDKIITEKLIIE
jgi:hypothetical protein